LCQLFVEKAKINEKVAGKKNYYYYLRKERNKIINKMTLSVKLVKLDEAFADRNKT